MGCCQKYIDLGCFASCGTVTLPYLATQSGVHTIVLHHGANYKSFIISATIGQALAFDMSNFNETGTTEITIINPSGSEYTVTIDEVVYCGFKIKTYVLYNSESTTSSDDVVCCSSILLEVTGTNTRTVLASEWAATGSVVPTIEVFYNGGDGYVVIPIQGVFDQMPVPTQVVVTIPDSTQTWYIKLS